MYELYRADIYKTELITPESINPAMMDDQIFSGGFEEVTPYFMNKDGCMEATADAAPESAMAAGATGMSGMPSQVPPPPIGMGSGPNPGTVVEFQIQLLF